MNGLIQNQVLGLLPDPDVGVVVVAEHCGFGLEWWSEICGFEGFGFGVCLDLGLGFW